MCACLAVPAFASADVVNSTQDVDDQPSFFLGDTPDQKLAQPVDLVTEARETIPAPSSTRRPLMNLLDRLGWADGLDRAGIDIYGFIQGSYTYNFNDPHRDDPLGDNPAQHRIQGRMFDHHPNRLALNRFDLFIQRAALPSPSRWDYGFLVEMQYGIDAAMMHSNGLLDYDSVYVNHADPEYQFDLTQAYFDLVTPIGNGLRIRAGKFATLIGYESCDPTTRTSIQFYSRSWILTMGIPMYQTGVIATYDFSDRLSVNAGFTRGWDQALEDVNDAIDFLGSVNYVINDQFTVYGAASVGPQQPDNNSDYRTLLNGTLYYTPQRGGPWTFALDSILGFEDNKVGGDGHPGFIHTRAIDNDGNHIVYPQDFDDTPVDSTYWFGIAGFAAYRINPNLVAKGRAEWFYDQDGTRWRVPINDPHATFPHSGSTYLASPMYDPFVQVGKSVSAFEFTLGLDWVPFPNDAKELLVRPEIRLDVADGDIFVNGDRSYQVTGAIDVIYKF
jgi:hypothetical protein